MEEPGQDERVERVSPDDEYDEYYPVNGGGAKMPAAGGWRQLAVPFVVSVIVSFGMLMFWAMPQMVTKDDFTNNLQSIVTDIGALKTADEEYTATLRTTSTAIGDMRTELQTLAASVNDKVGSNEINTLLNRLADLELLVAGLPTMDDFLPSLNDVEQDVTFLLGQVELINTTIETINTTIDEIKTQIEEIKAGDTGDGDGNGDGGTELPGVVEASAYNEPMYWAQGLPAGVSERAFGLKVTNTTDRDLIYVNITVVLQCSFPTSYFTADPQLLSNSGTIVWQYTPGLGNTLTFTGEGYIYVAADGEFGESQTLMLTIDTNHSGIYTVSVKSVTINSKMMQ